MSAREIKAGVKAVGVVDWNRRLFDELIPTPHGTSYNSYLVQGSEKTVLIDTVDPSMESIFIQNLESAGVKRIDYIVSNHAEQDHSGLIPRILEIFPESKVLTNAKCRAMLSNHLSITDDRFVEVADGSRVSLGDKTLEFILAPWVHWPETMFTYCMEDRILYSCDFLGSHFATGELFVTEDPGVLKGAKRYYSEIMMPFRTSIKRHIEVIRKLDVEMIAPSHGPVYKNPKYILDACSEWVSDDVKNEAVIIYVSMHGSTEMMVHHLADTLIDKGIGLRIFNLTRTDLGELAMSLIDAATLVVATPTVLAGAHPAVSYAVSLVNALRPKLRYAAIIGSYGWGGKSVEQLSGMLGNLKLEMLEPVLAKGRPGVEDKRALDSLAEKILKRHEALSKTE